MLQGEPAFSYIYEHTSMSQHFSVYLAILVQATYGINSANTR